MQNECVRELGFVGYFHLNIQQRKICWAKTKKVTSREADCNKLVQNPSIIYGWKCCQPRIITLMVTSLSVIHIKRKTVSTEAEEQTQ